MDFWVCEKSDGVRVLVFIVMNGGSGQQETWLVSTSFLGFCPQVEPGWSIRKRALSDFVQVDRKQRFFQVQDLHFPHWENPDMPLVDTVLDGELVIDIDPITGSVCLAFLCAM